MTLTGSCNRCGACCTLDIAGAFFTCEHLAPDRTCAVYESRMNLMPIVLHSASGETRQAHCGKDSPQETQAILRVIERCSMRAT